MNRRLKSLYGDLILFAICLSIDTTIWIYDADPFDQILFGCIFAIPMLGFAWRIVQAIRGRDMSTEALVEQINEEVQKTVNSSVKHKIAQ